MMHEMGHSMATLLYAGILGVLLVILSLMVSADRTRAKVDIGAQGGDDQFQRRNRAQGNLAEYLAAGIFLIFLVEMSGAAAWIVHALGIVFCTARVGHAVSILGKIAALRVLSATLTYGVIAVASVLCVVYYFGG
ncbi:MAG: hypothetical protein FJX65_06435 [Alphaproteobacteria bacterium]|nr:hypothetical protein [Alphaproteobacteria bacterium]